ncbi:MAG: DUF4870 domain-containing protein [Nocardioides sp.]
MSQTPPPPPGSYGPAPMSTQEERNWALAAHVGSLVAAWIAMGFLCPLAIMLTKGTESAFVRRHSVESLNFQLSLLIYLAVSFALVFVLIGFVLLPLVGIFGLVEIIIASVKASNGEEFRYPLTIRFVH